MISEEEYPYMFLDLAESSCETYSSTVRKKRDRRLKDSNLVGSRSLSRMERE